jgi:hypothetical protein
MADQGAGQGTHGFDRAPASAMVKKGMIDKNGLLKRKPIPGGA